MALQRVKRSEGFLKFQLLVSLYIFLIQIVCVGFADAEHERGFQPVEWLICELSQHQKVSMPFWKSNTLAICHKHVSVRGGDLSTGKETSTAESSSLKEDESSTKKNELDESIARIKDDIDLSMSPYAFTVFQENDGSQTDPDGIPDRYLKMQNNKRPQAKRALEATIQWRQEENINTILARPHVKFDVCKKVFPHYFCGRDDSGHVILMQRPGLIDLKMGLANGLTGDDLLYHYIYNSEYLWRILEPAANATMTSVIDLTALNLSILRKPELLKVAKSFCSTMDAHFPMRAHKTLLINAPKWFHALYKLLTPLLRESTKENIQIVSKGKEQEAILKTLLVECPMDSQSGLPLAQPTMEDEFRDFVLARLEESNATMQEVIL